MDRRTRRGEDARQLWVEGKDDSAVTQSLCAMHQLPRSFSVVAKEGVEEVLSTFYTLLRAPSIETVGLVVDANGDPRARWQSIRDTLKDEGYPRLSDTPDAAGIVVPGTPHRPRFGAWIMPDNRSPGALEDFAAALIPPGDALWPRAGRALDEIPPDERKFTPARRSKAHMHTWLAWQEQPGSPMGQAITKGDLDAHAPAAQAFVRWLRRLMIDPLDE